MGLVLIFLQERKIVLEGEILADACLIWLTQIICLEPKTCSDELEEHGVGRSVLNRQSHVSSIVSVLQLSLEQDEMAGFT